MSDIASSETPTDLPATLELEPRSTDLPKVDMLLSNTEEPTTPKASSIKEPPVVHQEEKKAPEEPPITLEECEALYEQLEKAKRDFKQAMERYKKESQRTRENRLLDRYDSEFGSRPRPSSFTCSSGSITVSPSYLVSFNGVVTTGTQSANLFLTYPHYSGGGFYNY